MNPTRQKAPLSDERGCLLCFIRATGKSWQTPVALRNTTKTIFEVSRNEICC